MLFLQQTSSKRRRHGKHKSRISHVNTAMRLRVSGRFTDSCVSGSMRSERFGDAVAASDNGAGDASGMPGIRTYPDNHHHCHLPHPSMAERDR